MIVAIACNDERNGMFKGRVNSIVIESADGCSTFELEDDFHGGMRCVMSGGRIRLGKREFPFTSQKQWYGNWCWDALTMTSGTVAELLNYLRSLGNWQPRSGPSDMWLQWNGGLGFSGGDLDRYFA